MADALAVALSKYADRFWGVSPDFSADVASHAREHEESNELDAEILAHIMWTMGASLKHKKCHADNDASYHLVCDPCEAYLLAIAELVLLTASLNSSSTEPPAAVTEYEAWTCSICGDIHEVGTPPGGAS